MLISIRLIHLLYVFEQWHFGRPHQPSKWMMTEKNCCCIGGKKSNNWLLQTCQSRCYQSCLHPSRSKKYWRGGHARSSPSFPPTIEIPSVWQENCPRGRQRCVSTATASRPAIEVMTSLDLRMVCGYEFAGARHRSRSGLECRKLHWSNCAHSHRGISCKIRFPGEFQ